MKIVKHTFKLDDQIVTNENGEMEIQEGAEIEGKFRFIGRSAYIFEETRGKGLLEVFGEVASADAIFQIMTTKNIVALCRASYIDVNNLNDADAGAIAFDESGLTDVVATDTSFVIDLMNALMEFMKVAPQDHKSGAQKSNKKGKSTSGKK